MQQYSNLNLSKLARRGAIIDEVGNDSSCLSGNSKTVRVTACLLPISMKHLLSANNFSLNSATAVFL